MADISIEIQKLYIAYFNRPADPAGLEYWTKVAVASGGNVTAVATSFSSSAEYTALYGGKGSTQIVDAIYQNLFGRSAELGGLVFWSQQLDSGLVNIGNMVRSVMAGAQGSDATVIANKVTAAMAFTTALDTAAEITGYSGTKALAAGRDYLAKITDATSSVPDAQTVSKAVQDATGTAPIVPGGTGGTSTPALVFSASKSASVVSFTNPGSAISVTVSGSDFTFTSSGGVSGTATINGVFTGVVVPAGTTLTVTQGLALSTTFSGTGTVKIDQTGAIGSASLATLDGNVSGLLDASAYTGLTATVAEAKLHLVTNQGTTIKTAADLAVTLDNTVSAAAADLNAINAATTGLVSSSTITTITGTATDVGTVLAATAVATALDLGAVTTVTLSDASGSVTLADGAVRSGQTLTVNGSALTAAHSLTFNGSAETDGSFVITGGAGADIIAGGAGADTITGGDGADTIAGNGGSDTLTGGAGVDDFRYGPTTSRSTLADLDTITDYRAAGADILTITDIASVASNANTVQARAGLTLAEALDAAATANTEANGLSVFLWGGDTYVYIEATGGMGVNTYAAGDFVVKLTGEPFAAGTLIAGLGIDGV